MNVFEFNSKVNLPSVCQADGIKGYEFIKLPKFGWFAYNRNRTEIKHIFEMFPDKDRVLLYKRFVKDERQHLDFGIQYSEHVQSRLNTSYMSLLSNTIAWKLAVAEVQQGKIYVKKAAIPCVKFLNDLGIGKLIEAGIGIVTKNITSHKLVGRIEWVEKAQNRMLIPSFCTPLHPCSFEVAKISDINDRVTAASYSERGWYGTLDTCIVPSLNDLAKTTGYTWDYKCDYWNQGVSAVSPSLPISQCLKIWVEAQQTRISKDLIDHIIQQGKQEDVKNHLRVLTKRQVEELEKKFKLPLMDNWKVQQQDEVTVADMKVIMKDNRYYIEHSNVTEEFTNFSIRINGVTKKKNQFYRIGHIYCNDGVYPFEIENKNFLNSRCFMKEMVNFFMENGIGVPIVAINFQNYILEAINKFNYNALLNFIVEGEAKN